MKVFESEEKCGFATRATVLRVGVRALLMVVFALTGLARHVAAQVAPSERRPEAPLGVFVSAADAFAAIAGDATAVLLDVRGLPSYLLGHPAGAVRTAWSDFSDPAEPGRLHPADEVLADRIGALGVGDDSEVFIVGAWADGWGEEGRLYWMFEYLGHDRVHIIEGGYPAWQEAGLPTEVAARLPERRPFTVSRQTERVADLAEVVGAAQSEEEHRIDLVDVRTGAEYDGATPHGSVRGGHIPGARHLYWRALFDAATGKLRPADEIEALFPNPDVRVVTYCTGGVRSGFVYAVLRQLGRTNVANYAGSWWEYSRQ